MKNVGCFGWIAILFIFGLLFQGLKDPVWGPILIIGFLALLVWLLVAITKPGKKKASDFLPDSSRPTALTLGQRRAGEILCLSKEIASQESTPIPLRAGEGFIYRMSSVDLIESRSSGASYRGGNSGFSFRVAKGISYRVGTGGGNISRNQESLQVIDTGVLMFTSQRLIFSGSKASREWALSKVTNIERSEDGLSLMISVSNRQKPSGVISSNRIGLEPALLLEIALEYYQNGKQAAVDRCRREAGVGENSAASAEVGPASEQATSEQAASKSEQAASKSAPTAASAATTQKPAGAAKPQLTESEDAEELDVVGESFHAEAFEMLRVRYGADFGETHDFVLDLVAEPFNKFSKNGHAVAVQLDGQVLGHLSEDDNSDFFELLKQVNGRASCRGQIYFAPKEPIMKNSVVLFTDVPPELK